MFQSFIYLSKRLFNFWVNTYLMSHSFFVATSILDASQFVKMLWFMSLCYEILIVVLNLFFLFCYFSLNFSPVSFACNFQDWGCVILREIDFLLKICWSIPCLHRSWKVHTWTIVAIWRKVRFHHTLPFMTKQRFRSVAATSISTKSSGSLILVLPLQIF